MIFFKINKINNQILGNCTFAFVWIRTDELYREKQYVLTI